MATPLVGAAFPPLAANGPLFPTANASALLKLSINVAPQEIVLDRAECLE